VLARNFGTVSETLVEVAFSMDSCAISTLRGATAILDNDSTKKKKKHFLPLSHFGKHFDGGAVVPWQGSSKFLKF